MLRHIYSFLGACILCLPLSAQNKKIAIAETGWQKTRHAFISRQGNLYGLGDSSGWYKDTPLGDSIFHLGFWHYAVRNNGLYHIYKNDNPFRLIQSNSMLPVTTGRFILVKDSIGARLLDQSSETFSLYVDSIVVSGHHAWLYKNGKQGIQNLTASLDQMIKPEYDQVGLYHGGILLIRNNKLGWIGSLTIPVMYDHIYLERPDVMAVKDSRGISYYSLSTGNMLNTLPGDSVVFYDHHYKRIRGKHQSIFSLKDNRLTGEIDNYSIHPYSFDDASDDMDYCVVSNDSMCALYKHGAFLTGFDYENILDISRIPPPYFRIVQHGQVGLINAQGATILKPIYSDIMYKMGDRYEVRKGNYLGIVSTNDEVILPAEYLTVRLEWAKYALVSKDDVHFGLYDLAARKTILPCKYRDIDLDSNLILAQYENIYDVYYKNQAVLTDVHDAQIHNNTAKGYKDGKIFIGLVRNDTWEMDNYEIPSYKVMDKARTDYDLVGGSLPQTIEMYDYAKGKWGFYNIPSGTWSLKPVAHSGDESNGTRLLPFYSDSSMSWLGIDFKIRKGMIPLGDSYMAGNQSFWLDLYPYRYLVDDEKNRTYGLSPVYFKDPASGRAYDGQTSFKLSAIFRGIGSHSAYNENGKLSMAGSGDITLSDYICQLSANGCTHPATIADYEKIINPHAYIQITGGTDHIIDSRGAGKKHVSIYTAFEWVNKTDINDFIVRQNGKYGLLSDSATYLLNPVYESIEPFPMIGDILYQVGMRSNSCRVYDPATQKLSGLVEQVLDYNDQLLLIKRSDGMNTVLNAQLDTLLITRDSISLLTHEYFQAWHNRSATMYKGAQALFTHTQMQATCINPNFFLLNGGSGSCVLSNHGDTLLKSNKLITCPFSNDNFLLEYGTLRRLYTANGQLITEFEKSPYEFNEAGDLVILEKEQIRLYRHHETTELKRSGKFVSLTTRYLIVKVAKTENVYDINGEALVSGIKNARALSAFYFTYKQGKQNKLMDLNTQQAITIRQPVTSILEDGFDYVDPEGVTQTVNYPQVYKPYVTNRNGLYGVSQNSEALGSKTILPCKYYNIIAFGDRFLVQDHIEYMLYSLYTRSFTTPQAYDHLVPYLDYIQTIRKGKIAYLKN